MLREFASIRYEVHSYKRRYGTVSVYLFIDLGKVSQVILYRDEVMMSLR